MKQIEMDRETLKRLVESYGKDDVKNFVLYINESRNDDLNAVQECVRRISEITGGLKEEILNQIQQVLEDLVDTVQNEPYELGVEEGKKVGYDEAYEEGYNDGYQNGKDEGYNRGYQDMYDKIESRGFFGRMRSPRTLLTDDD